MTGRILHVLDGTTPPDAVEMLAQLLPLGEHRLVTLGHRSTLQMMRNAGIGEEVTCLHSMGWADPTGWRGLRRVVKEYMPTHIHAWGIPAAIAATVPRFKGKRVVTLVDLPHAWHLQLLAFIHNGGWMRSTNGCRWIVTASWLKHVLHTNNVPANDVTLVRQGIGGSGAAYNGSAREELGLLPEDGPIVILGGDGGMKAVLAGAGVDPVKQGGRGGPRHDLGMWATGIVQQMFPRVRAVVRQDARGRANAGLDRLLEHMANEEVTILAPGHWPWEKLMSMADLLLVTPDGPFAAGSVAHAFAAGVPVIGTPVDSVREHIVDGENGLIAPSTRAREIAAVMERFLSDEGRQREIGERARESAGVKYGVAGMRAAYEKVWES